MSTQYDSSSVTYDSLCVDYEGVDTCAGAGGGGGSSHRRYVVRGRPRVVTKVVNAPMIRAPVIRVRS